MTLEIFFFSIFCLLISGIFYLSVLRSRVKSIYSEVQDAHLKLIEEISSEKGRSEKLAAALEKAEKLADLHTSKNADFERQSREAWEMYRKAGLAAGSAQSWLLRELERSVALINKYRAEKGEQPIEVNAKLKDLLANFKKEHISEESKNDG